MISPRSIFPNLTALILGRWLPGGYGDTGYRARQRGESAPKRKPGPKRADITELRQEIGELQARIAGLALHRRLATERLARRALPLTVEQVAQELLNALRHDDLSRDSRERQVLLRDLVVEIEDRHEHWPE